MWGVCNAYGEPPFGPIEPDEFGPQIIGALVDASPAPSAFKLERGQMVSPRFWLLGSRGLDRRPS